MFIQIPQKPTCEEALQRLRKVMSQHFDPPLSASERDYIVARCIDGDNIFLRCSWHHNSSACVRVQ